MRASHLMLAAALLVAAAPAQAGKVDGQPRRPGDAVGDQSITLPNPATWEMWEGVGPAARVYVDNAEHTLLYYHPVVIQNLNVIAGSNPPDSSASYQATGAKLWALWCFPTFDDSTAAALFSVQIRGARVQSNDSLSAHAWQKRWSPADTCLFDCAVKVDTLMSVGNMARSPTKFLNSTADSLVLPTEFPWPMAGVQQPRGRMVFLCDSESCFGGVDFISVRVRLLNTLNATGRPYGRLSETRVSYKFTLVGYR